MSLTKEDDHFARKNNGSSTSSSNPLQIICHPSHKEMDRKPDLDDWLLPK